MESVRTTCTLRPEVTAGDLQDALFAADFGHVVEGRAPAVYQDASTFLDNTHPAAPLRKVVETVFDRLADAAEPGAALRLSTGFGGGKTHTLIALWHLARNCDRTTLGTELLPAAGRPKNVAVAGIDGEKLGAAVCGRHEELITRSLWGELAYQLGGTSGHAKLAPVDDPETAPDAGLVRAMLPVDRPVLILLDELVKYMVKLSDQGRGAMLAFVGSLISEIGARSRAVLVITDPAGQQAYQGETAQLEEVTAELKVAHRLDDELGRKTTDFDPIGGEAAQVIVRRLFASIRPGAADAASAEYFAAYQRVRAAHPDALPAESVMPAYAKRIKECYPFHPRLLETAQNRLGALQNFHKSRGTLRLFARILRDIWERGVDVPLICAGDLNWASDRIQADLLQRLNRDEFRAAVNADVLKHAGALDEDFATDAHRRVAAALLLESIPYPQNPSAGLDRQEATLAVLRPDEAGHEPAEALDRLLGACWHTYRDESGRRFQFRFEANVNKLIEERSAAVPWEDARMGVLTCAQGYFGGHTFKLVAFPGSPREVADSSTLKLVLCDSPALAQRVCDFEDDSDPAARRPRALRNAIFAIAPSEEPFGDAVRLLQQQMAAEALEREQPRRSMIRAQLVEILPGLKKRAARQALRAFTRVLFQGRPAMTLEEKYLVSDERPLEKVRGQEQLRSFLDDHGLVYQHRDVIDTDLLLEEILPGATPSPDHTGAFTASSVHERALSHPRLRLLPDEAPVRGAVLQAVAQGKLAVRLPGGDAYLGGRCTTGPPGDRKQVEKPLHTLQLSVEVLVAPANAPCVAEWTRVDERPTTNGEDGDDEDNGNHGEPDGAGPVTAYDWKTAVGYAEEGRPLRALILKAASIDDARTLAALAQPFGAETLRLTLLAGGGTSEGGSLYFKATDVRHNHPLKPLDVAAQLLRAADVPSPFEASLALEFPAPGLDPCAHRLVEARDQAGPGVRVQAHFGPASEEDRVYE